MSRFVLLSENQTLAIASTAFGISKTSLISTSDIKAGWGDVAGVQSIQMSVRAWNIERGGNSCMRDNQDLQADAFCFKLAAQDLSASDARTAFEVDFTTPRSLPYSRLHHNIQCVESSSLHKEPQ